MPKVSYDVIAASKPFRFLVGPDKKECFMHANLVARMSKPLWTLVNGKWKESEGCLVDWSDVDEETFVRFCEFSYTGYYQAAEPFSIEPPTPTPPEGKESDKRRMETPSKSIPLMIEEPAPELMVRDSWGTLMRPPKKITTTSKKDVMLDDFKRYVDEAVPDSAPSEASNTNPLMNYSEVFLSHARLYAFADCYAIDDLTKLCIRRLHRALLNFNLHGGTRAADVAKLIDFSYKNTRSDTVKQDKLRGLLSAYIACHVEEIWPNLYFRDVIELGEVANDIIGKLLRRLD
ncbi:uncharacterized protein F4807DRAFT_426401 [Annulohypoxylon truncatum]|uniref:uncharacterized protein n=1 Tax=Annulohypoxylon truncatum TaxID=327061 RepID=UPI0020073AA7|nr:uncharacterized protein F4807DRAFT_426401 [Annulohypoxylon truncatum]KAI1209346.1 hypothetical protein F4807DRAFT_426401 [Annulohypoxylon truncatum]